MNRVLLTLLASTLLACPSEEPSDPTPVPPARLPDSVVDSVSPERMRTDVDFLASDALGGRIPESPGHDEARDWILAELAAIGVEPLGLDGYVYEYEHEPIGGRYFLDADGVVQESTVTTGRDLVALLPGSDPILADEYVVVAGHYDHIGVTSDGRIYNGAFDDAAGTAVVLELARTFVNNGVAPARSIVFLITDDEESGLHGARAWASAPTVPSADIVGMISVDPVGRPVLPDFSPTLLIGAERSPRFADLLARTAEWSEQPVFFLQRELIPVFASDQDAFYEADPPVPGTWLVNPGMSFYHQVGDTPETIDYRTLLRTAKWTLQAVYALAQDDLRYPWEGAQPIGVPAMQGAQTFFGALLKSEHLTSEERAEAESYYWTLQGAIEAGDPDEIPNYTSFISEAVLFLLLDLAQNHPGEIPPPFPE